MFDTDVFVIGGGPAGLAAAIAARQHGFTVMLADAARPPVDKACGEGLMPDGVAALRRLGVSIPPAEYFPFRGIRFVEGGASFAGDFPNGYGFGLRRTALHQILVDHADRAGVRLLWGRRVRGISADRVELEAEAIRARWIVGADGSNSRVRAWAGLDARRHDSHRFGFRRHYCVTPWSEFMEIHWATGAQIYVTPVSSDQVCVALISRDPHLRLEDALPCFPEIAARLANAPASTPERGAVTATRKLGSVYSGRVALIGDASGSVDAITGEGLCLSFRQANALGEALAYGDLARYDAAHRTLRRRPAFMARFMLAFDRRTRLRSRAFRALASHPRIFSDMLAMHVGALSAPTFAADGVRFAWRLLTV